MDSPVTHTAALEVRCQAWHLQLELDLLDSSLTFDAVQWALSSLLAIQHAESSQKWTEPRQDAVTAAELITANQTLDMNQNPDDGPEDGNLEYGNLEVLCKIDVNAEPERVAVVAGELQDTGEEYMEVCNDEIELAEEIKHADKGEAGQRMAEVINDRLSVPGCSSLVKLIQRCLLLSLDQETPDNVAVLLSSPNQHDLEGVWLHSWLFKSLLSTSKLSCKRKRGVLSRDMDWLVACLSAASPEQLFPVLFNIVARKCLYNRLPLSLLVRVAAVLEFAFIRHGEYAAFMLLSSIQIFQEDASNKKPAQNVYDCDTTWGFCFSSIWLTLGFLCPGIFSGCICLLVLQRLNETSVKKWWHLLQSWNIEKSPLVDLSRILLGRSFEGPQNLKDWLCTILRRRLVQLSPAAADIILLLNQLCSHSTTESDTKLAEAAHSMLEAISQELCQHVFPKILGVGATEASNNVTLFIENLQLNFMRVWPGLLESYITSNRKTSDASMRSIYEHPAIQICFSIILCCDAQVVAEILANSTRLTSPTAKETKCSTQLVFVINLMQILAGRAESQLIFELWAQNLVDQVQNLNVAQACTRILAVKKMLELSSGKFKSGSSLSVRLVEAGNESEVDLWVPVHYHLVGALRSQWPQLLSLLHWDEAWEMRSIVLGILELLCPDESSHYQETIRRIKRTLGFLFVWLDKAYGIHNEAEYLEVRYKGLLTNGTEADEKWQFVQVIEQIKRVIVQMTSTRLISFTLMTNSLLDYSFNRIQRALPEAVVTKNNRNGVKCRGTYTEIVDREGGFAPDKLVAAQLKNLLCGTIAQISKQQEQGSKNNVLLFQPAIVITKLLVDHLQTPHEVPMTREQYEEVLPKYVSASRHIFLINCFNKNPFLFEMLEIIVREGGENEVQQCMEFLRALLSDGISYWHSSNRVHKHHTSASLQVMHDKPDRVQACRLIQMISMAGLLPQPLASSSEIVSLLDAEDMADLLTLVWHLMHHNQQKFSKPKSAVQEGVNNHSEESGEKKDWEDQHFAILQKNVAQIGSYFSQVNPKQAL